MASCSTAYGSCQYRVHKRSGARNNRMGVAVLEPGTRRKDEPHAQELGLRSIEGCGGKVLLNDSDALVGPILFAIDEKLIVTFETFRRISNKYSRFYRYLFG